jgi:predicted SAM-dependent methyltransferase
VLHHLTTDEKRSALRTARQLLRPGGELHISDLGPPVNRYVRSVLSRVGPVLGGDRVAANISGRLPALMREAGFSEVAETDQVKTAFGRVAFYRATT